MTDTCLDQCCQWME